MARDSRIGDTALAALLAVACLLVAAGTVVARPGEAAPRGAGPAAAPAPLTGIYLDSEPGNWVIGGTAYFGPGDHSFSTAGSSSLAFHVGMEPGTLSLTFGTATAGVDLIEGQTYQVAPWPNPATGMIYMGLGGRGCTSGTGEFTMLDWQLLPDGTVISAAVDFHHDCDDGSATILYGSVRINSMVPITALDISDGPAALGTFRTGTRSADATVTLTNPGSVPVSLGTVGISGTNAAGIEVDASDCGSELAAGASCGLLVASEGIQRGAIDARLTISDGTSRGEHWVAVMGRVQDATASSVTLARVGGAFNATVTVTPVAAIGRVDFEIRSAGGGTTWEIGYIASAGTTTTGFAPPLGPFDVIAHYRGEADFEPSDSEPAAAVAKVPTVIDLSAPQTQVIGNSILVTAGVRSYFYPLPPGTLEVRDGSGALVATLAVSGAAHQISVELPADTVGRHTWTATYTSTAGDADPATATTWTDVVPPLLTTLGIIGAPITNNPTVTLQLANPTTPDGVVRISNDGEHWVERPWTPTVSWSLTGPDGGGTDTDGLKTVTAFYGEDGVWTMYGTTTIELDRVAPAVQSPAVNVDQRTWAGTPTLRPWDWAAVRYSLDGVAWTPWRADGVLDLWSTPGAASWYAGGRAIWVEAKDVAGNASAPVAGTATFSDDDLIAPAGGSGPVAVGFELPQPAITGHAFTIHPAYPIGYVIPANAWCEWTLRWGNEDALLRAPEGSWGGLAFERPAASGACDEWTFTLPFTTDRQLKWTFDLYLKGPSAGPGERGPSLYTGPTNRVFKALADSRDPHIQTSSLPVAYVLPAVTGPTRAGVAVTYQLHLAGPGTLPATGDWSATASACALNPPLARHGGTGWTYTPRCKGLWVTRWHGVMGGGDARSQVEAFVDGTPPAVTAPRVAIRSATVLGTVPVTVAWTGSDSGSGVSRYQLQVRRNGGAWLATTLANRRVPTMTRVLATTGSYQFRVRARDGVGNWSGWAEGAVIRPRQLQESTSAARYSSGWSRVTASALSGGAARTTIRAGAWVRFTISGRAFAWTGRRGPGMGIAEVLVDGIPVTTIDLGAAAWSRPQVLFAKTWGSIRTHQVIIRNLGTAGRPRVEIDSVLVLQ